MWTEGMDQRHICRITAIGHHDAPDAGAVVARVKAVPGFAAMVGRVQEVRKYSLMTEPAATLQKVAAKGTDTFARVHRHYLAWLRGVVQMDSSYALPKTALPV